MDNITYEFFIRRCWLCKRFHKGANTDTWENLRIKYDRYINSNEHDKAKCKCEYDNQLTRIKDYLDKAYIKLLETAKHIEGQDYNTLKDYQITVSNSENPEEIYTTISLSLEIMNNHKLNKED